MKSVKKVALITNYNINEKLSAAARVIERIAPFADGILINQAYKDRILRNRLHRSNVFYLPDEELYASADVAIVIGGDGSMLDAIRKAAPLKVPVLGVNMGRIGYMTELEPDEIGLLDKVFVGEYAIEERTLLGITIVSPKGQVKFKAEALNEAVIANGSTARIVDLELSCDGEVVNTYRADGLVVATPTGSTAYSLSAGGPIVDPQLHCLCVTPVCPHSLMARPLVFPDSAELKVKNICTREKVLHLTVDGRLTFDMFYGDVAALTKSPTRAKLLRVKDGGFGSKIRLTKLM